jgi:hypothetical protein
VKSGSRTTRRWNGQQRREPVDLHLVEGPATALERLLPGRPGDDQLGEQGVERPADDRARLDAGVHAHPGSAGRDERRDGARRRQEAATRVLTVDAELEAVAAGLRVVEGERLPLGDAELLADEVDAGDLLADGVLHLQAGVHLQEADEPVLADEELARARADVPGLADDVLRRGVQLRGLLLGQERRGRLLDHLLVAPLQRAVPRRDHHDVAVRVGEHLRLHVPRLVQVALDEALAPPEGRDGLADGRLVQLRDLLLGAGDLQTASSTAEGRLDGDRQAVLGDEGEHLVDPRHRVGRAGHERRTDPQRDVPSGRLVAQGGDRVRRRADPGGAGVQDGLRELGVLGQEPVARVHGVGAGGRERPEHLVDAQVRVAGRGAAERERLVGDPDVQRVEVGLGVHRDRREPGVAAGARDPDGDLAAVGDQDLAHSCSLDADGAGRTGLGRTGLGRTGLGRTG